MGEHPNLVSMARAPLSAADRQRLLAAFEKSGLTQEQFCAGLSATGNLLGDLSLNLRPLRTLRAWVRAARGETSGVDAEAVVVRPSTSSGKPPRVLEAAVADTTTPDFRSNLQPAAASEQVASHSRWRCPVSDRPGSDAPRLR